MSRDPRLYNAPLYVNTFAPIADNDAFAFIDPGENHNGRFLVSAAAWARRAAATATVLALVIARAKPTFENYGDGYAVRFSEAGALAYVSPDVTEYSTTLYYAPKRSHFVPPGYGVFLVARATALTLAASAVFYFDTEQAGR